MVNLFVRFIKTLCILACVSGCLSIQSKTQEKPIVLAANKIVLQKAFCPPVETLTKDPEGGWVGPGGWKTNTASLANSLTTFISAQWIGIGVGQVICLYIKEGRGAFPVALKLDVLVPAPQIGIWGEDKGGYRNCNSRDIKDCPFFFEISVKPDDPYKELDFYKGKPIND